MKYKGWKKPYWDFGRGLSTVQKDPRDLQPRRERPTLIEKWVQNKPHKKWKNPWSKDLKKEPTVKRKEEWEIAYEKKGRQKELTLNDRTEKYSTGIENPPFLEALEVNTRRNKREWKR